MIIIPLESHQIKKVDIKIVYVMNIGFLQAIKVWLIYFWEVKNKI